MFKTIGKQEFSAKVLHAKKVVEGTIHCDQESVDIDATYTIECVNEGVTYRWTGVKPKMRDGHAVLVCPPQPVDGPGVMNCGVANDG